jgi:G:T-mismatch repair DNA endonuclease (very short patch repair protein)
VALVIETATYAALHGLGIRYGKQQALGHYVLDSFLPEIGIAVEVQGDFWHCNPATSPQGPEYPIQRKMVRRDKAKRTYRSRRSIQVVELWESDIHREGARVLLERALEILAKSEALPSAA